MVVPAGTGTSWNSPTDPTERWRTGAETPFTVAADPSRYWTRRTRIDGCGQSTRAWSHPTPTTRHVLDPVRGEVAAEAGSRANTADAVGSSQTSARESR